MAFVVSWMAFAGLGCSDTTATSTADAAAGDQGDGSSSSDGATAALDATVTDSGSESSADSGAPLDADAAPSVDASDAASSDAAVGFPLDPGKVACGSTTCSTPTDTCCTDDGGACQPSAGVTCNGNVVGCDEAADCAPGNKCCLVTDYLYLSPGNGPALSTDASYMCATSCDQLGYEVHRVTFQACKTTAECGGSFACLVQTCGGKDFQTCGNIDSKSCK
jgi:hypothetical protein